MINKFSPKILVSCLAFALANLALAQAPTQNSDWERLTQDGLYRQRPAWSPDQKVLVFAKHEAGTIFLFQRVLASGQETRLTDRTDPEFDAVWSPDGTRLAFTFDKTSPNQGDLELYTITAEGKDLQRVTGTEGKLSHEESPAWSADGQWLAYSSTRDDNQEIYRIRPNGKDRQRLTNDPALDAHPAWSPDGRQVAFATNRWGDLELALVDVETAKVQRLTDSRGLDDYPAFSPDGKTLAFTSNRDGNFEIYLLDLTSGVVRNLTRSRSLENFPTWTREGQVTFLSNRAGTWDLYLLRP